MPVDPGIRQLLALLEQMQRPTLASGTADEARAAFRMLAVEARQPEHVVPVGSVSETTVDGAAGPLPARVYVPEDGAGDGAGVPTVVFFHGGGFVIGDLETHDNQCRWVCREVGAVVVSVAYRLAPEERAPAASEDCLAATRWAAAHVEELGGDGTRLAVAGDSAGGNLAAVTAQRCRDEGGPALAAQLLIYPAVDFDEGSADYPSREENAEGYFLTGEDMRWFAAQYLPPGQDASAPGLSPLRGRLEGLPPAVVVTAEYDPLRDEGEAYAHALSDAGVQVTLLRFDGMIHGFFDMAPLSPAVGDAVRTTCASLREVLERR